MSTSLSQPLLDNNDEEIIDVNLEDLQKHIKPSIQLDWWYILSISDELVNNPQTYLDVIKLVHREIGPIYSNSGDTINDMLKNEVDDFLSEEKDYSNTASHQLFRLPVAALGLLGSLIFNCIKPVSKLSLNLSAVGAAIVGAIFLIFIF